MIAGGGASAAKEGPEAAPPEIRSWSGRERLKFCLDAAQIGLNKHTPSEAGPRQSPLFLALLVRKG